MTNNELGDQVHDNIRERRQRQLEDLRFRLKRAESKLTLVQIHFDEAEEELEMWSVDLQQSRQQVEDLTDAIELLERDL